jgi:hypothetical protein
MADLRDRIRKDEGSFQKLLASIPGFDGYREREIRRAADKILRDHLVTLVDGARERLRAVISDCARAGKLAALDPLDRLAGRLVKLRDNIRLADYGYTGFFDAAKIKEDELDRMYEYDLSLREEVGGIQGAVAALAVEALAADAAQSDAALADLDTRITRIQQMLDERGAITASLVP